MKPARFDYIRTETLAEAHAALAADGNDARVGKSAFARGGQVARRSTRRRHRVDAQERDDDERRRVRGRDGESPVGYDGFQPSEEAAPRV